MWPVTINGNTILQAYKLRLCGRIDKRCKYSRIAMAGSKQTYGRVDKSDKFSQKKKNHKSTDLH